MKALILAAGIGKRLYQYTNNIPKCMVKVDKKEIIKWEIEALLPFDLEEIIVIIGYKGNLVKEFINNNFLVGNIKFIENKDYLITSNLHSLKLGLSKIKNKDDILIINGDLVFRKDVVNEILKSDYENVVAVNKIPCNEEDMKVCIKDVAYFDKYNFNRISEISKDIPLDKANGQALGIYKIKDVNVLKKKTEEIDKMNFFNEAINQMIKDVSIFSIDITQFQSIEIDFPKDLEEANTIFKTKDL